MLVTFRHFIGKLRILLSPLMPKSKMVTGIFVVSLVLVACVISTTVVFGQADIFSPTVIINAIIQVLSWIILRLAKLAVTLTIFGLEFFIEIAKYNGYSEAPPVLLGWYMIRDIANMFFVIALLIIAFGTILGLDNYEWKKTLGKLIVAAILINFSKLIAQFIIDIAHVFTMTFVNAISATAGGNLINMFNFDSLFNVLPQDTELAGGGDNLRLDIFASSVLILGFAVISMVTMFSYVIVMAIRMVVLWVAIILSPLAYILSVLPPTEKYASEYWSQFINHVIAAPVMVFFLWIAFAAFGSGNIAEQIGVDPSTYDSPQQANNAIALGLPAEPTSSLTEASTWQNMSSFIIAIAFLIIGIERVQSLNVKGGGLTETAINWGKATVAIASGYAAGRWLVDKGFEGAKWTGKEVGYRVPLVGGAALQEYGAAIASTYKRKGILGVASVGTLSGLGGAESKISRSETAKNWEQKSGVAKPFGWIAARVWEPAERANKRKEDWIAAGERVQKIQEESYTTSSTRAGQAKLNATVELKKVEEKAAAKAAAKVADRLKEARDIREIYQDLKKEELKNISDSLKQVNPTLTEDQINKKTEEEYQKNQENYHNAHVAEAKKRYLDKVAREADRVKQGSGAKERQKVERLLNRDGGIAERLKLAGKIDNEIKVLVQSNAERQEADLRERQYIELAQAQAQDDVRAQNNLSRIYVKATEAKHLKEKQEFSGNLDYDDRKASITRYIDKIKKSSDPQVFKDAISLAASSFASDSETGMDVFKKALAASGYTEDAFNTIPAGDRLKRQALFFSALQGEYVDFSKTTVDNKFVQDVFKKFVDKLGGERAALPILKELNDGLKRSVFDGALNLAGIIKAEPTPDGQVKYSPVDNDNAFTATREYFAARIKPSVLTGIDDIVGNAALKNGFQKETINPSTNQVVIVNDDVALSQLRLILNSINGNTGLTGALKKQLSEIKNSDEAFFTTEILHKINKEASNKLKNIL